MQVKSIAECPLEHSAILSSFIKLPFCHLDICFAYLNFEVAAEVFPLNTSFTVTPRQAKQILITNLDQTALHQNGLVQIIRNL